MTGEQPRWVAQFHALLGQADPPDTEALEPYFEHLALLATRRQLALEPGAEPLRAAGYLFQRGCAPLRFYDPYQLLRVTRALIWGEVPAPPLAYQLFTYILRLEKYQCRSHLRFMMPLIALSPLPAAPACSGRSRMLVNALQAFNSAGRRYTAPSIRHYDPLDLLAKFQRMIRGIAQDPAYRSDVYLLSTLDSMSELAAGYLCTYLRRTSTVPEVVKQARRSLNWQIQRHQTVARTPPPYPNMHERRTSWIDRIYNILGSASGSSRSSAGLAASKTLSSRSLRSEGPSSSNPTIRSAAPPRR